MRRTPITHRIAWPAFALALLPSAPMARFEASMLSPQAGQRGGEGSLAQPQRMTPEARKAIAVDAYVYGYPLVTMEMTRRVVTNVAKPDETHAPMGQLIRMRSYPTAAFREVTAPNADTLYTTAFFDVSKEPWVLSVPEARGRYYLMPMLDGW